MSSLNSCGVIPDSVDNDIEDRIEWTITVTGLEEATVVLTPEIFNWQSRNCFEIYNMDSVKKKASQ
jgi:hypothetical protein